MWNEKLERLPRVELEALQLERLRELVSVLTSRVPFYQQRLQRAGIKPESISALEDVRHAPFTTKSDLRDNYPFGMLAVDQSQVSRVHASSGTRGKPTIVAYTKQDLNTWAELCARSLAATGARPGDILQNAYGYGLFTGGLGLHYGAENLGATVVPASAGRTQQQILLMQDLGVRVLCCTPSYAMNIAETLKQSRTSKAPQHQTHQTNQAHQAQQTHQAQQGQTALKVEIGVFGAEPWSEECRRQIQNALDIQAYDIYGLSEIMGPGVACECVAQSGLHLWEDHFIAEIIDPQSLQPVPLGVQGELVLTTLTKQALPLLRYRTGDVCSLIAEPCECGRTSRRITRLQGRLDDMLIVRGVNVYPCEIESVLYGMPELSSEYQIIVQREQSMDILRIRAELDSAALEQWRLEKVEELQRRSLEQQITDTLHQRLGLSAITELVEPNALPRSEGKSFRVVDMRNL